MWASAQMASTVSVQPEFLGAGQAFVASFQSGKLIAGLFCGLSGVVLHRAEFAPTQALLRFLHRAQMAISRVFRTATRT